MLDTWSRAWSRACTPPLHTAHNLFRSLRWFGITLLGSVWLWVCDHVRCIFFSYLSLPFIYLWMRWILSSSSNVFSPKTMGSFLSRTHWKLKAFLDCCQCVADINLKPKKTIADAPDTTSWLKFKGIIKSIKIYQQRESTKYFFLKKKKKTLARQ